MKTTIRNVICIIAFTILPAICQIASMDAQEFVKSDFPKSACLLKNDPLKSNNSLNRVDLKNVIP